MHCGMGPTATNNFLTTLNIRGLHHTTLLARQREIGQVIETEVQESMTEALREEVRYYKKLTVSDQNLLA